jgi:uncharacterized protein (TIGR02145 family)
MRNSIFLLMGLALIVSCKKNIPPVANISVTPGTGNTLTRFMFDAGGCTDTETATDKLTCRWDWESDGTWDTEYSTSKTAVHLFSTQGIYLIKLQVADEEGLTSDTNVSLTVASSNKPPEASFSFNPLSGDANTVFNFDASNCNDAETPADSLEVRWDWSGDGVWDHTWSMTKTVPHVFSSAGTYQVIMEVKDSEGLTSRQTKSVAVSRVVTAPIANFTITPDKGEESVVFQFDGSASSDAETLAIDLEVRWDWTGDGTWDTNLSKTKTAAHQYSSAGTYTIIMEVKDVDGLTDTETRTLVVTKTIPTFTDARDNHIYKYVVIGSQTWMAENLAWLPSVSQSGSGSSSCYYVFGYDGTVVTAAKATVNYAIYGVLYNYPAARKACPAGWHLPTDDEWKTLEKNQGMTESEANGTEWRNSGNVGGKLKEAGTVRWKSPNTGADNISGFTILPAGGRSNEGVVDGLGTIAGFWSDTKGLALVSWGRLFMFDTGGIYRYFYYRSGGFSVRCVKN